MQAEIELIVWSQVIKQLLSFSCSTGIVEIFQPGLYFSSKNLISVLIWKHKALPVSVWEYKWLGNQSRMTRQKPWASLFCPISSALLLFSVSKESKGVRAIKTWILRWHRLSFEILGVVYIDSVIWLCCRNSLQNYPHFLLSFFISQVKWRGFHISFPPWLCHSWGVTHIRNCFVSFVIL